MIQKTRSSLRKKKVHRDQCRTVLVREAFTLKGVAGSGGRFDVES